MDYHRILWIMDSPRPLKAKAAGPRYGAQAIWYGAGMAHRLSQGGNSNLATKQISWIIMDYRGLSWIIDYLGLWWIIMNYNGLSRNLKDYDLSPGLSRPRLWRQLEGMAQVWRIPHPFRGHGI